MSQREATVDRVTNETKVRVELRIDGSGAASAGDTGSAAGKNQAGQPGHGGRRHAQSGSAGGS